MKFIRNSPGFPYLTDGSALRFNLNLQANIPGHRLEVRRRHVIRRSAFRERPNRVSISEHLRERDLRDDEHQFTLRNEFLYATAPTIQIADDVTLPVRGRVAFHRHDRLQNDRSRFRYRILQRETARDLKREIVRVNVMVRPADDIDFEIDKRCTGQRT